MTTVPDDIDDIVKKIKLGSRKSRPNAARESTHINDKFEEPNAKPKLQLSARKKVTDGTDENTDKNITLDEVNFDKLDEKTAQAHKDLFSGSLDVYKIMGLSPDSSQDLVRKKCNEKIAKYHPDKIEPALRKVPPEQRSKEKKKMDMQYKLVRDAYSILINPDKRKFYDLQKKTIDSKNFAKQKASFEEFIKLQDSEISEQSRKNAENTFKLEYAGMDEKHKLKRS